MAHFAELDNNNIVIRVVRVENSVLLKADGTESELKGKQFLNSLFGNSTWKQTSWMHNFRGNFAGVGYTYDSERDAFIAPQPFPSWSLNDKHKWQAPIEMPEGKICGWDEDNQQWVIHGDRPADEPQDFLGE
tara:strand:+ start:81 stop:476 length:396 start_codon:yes stop_codon:yes gene_type:complete